MKLGVVIVKDTQHVLAVFTSRGIDPAPTAETAVAARGFPIRDASTGEVIVMLPRSILDVKPAEEVNPDRLRLILTQPTRFSYDPTAKQFTELADHAGAFTLTTGSVATLSIGAGAVLFPAPFAIAVQDLPVANDAASTFPPSPASVQSAGAATAAGNVPATARRVLFVRGALPVIA
jgi:hypothetical protein